MKIRDKEFNITTGEETITERDETAYEIKSREALENATLAKQTQAEAKATAKAALLSKLGITEDEAKLLLS